MRNHRSQSSQVARAASNPPASSRTALAASTVELPAGTRLSSISSVRTSCELTRKLSPARGERPGSARRGAPSCPRPRSRTPWPTNGPRGGGRWRPSGARSWSVPTRRRCRGRPPSSSPRRRRCPGCGRRGRPGAGPGPTALRRGSAMAASASGVPSVEPLSITRQVRSRYVWPRTEPHGLGDEVAPVEGRYYDR